MNDKARSTKRRRTPAITTELVELTPETAPMLQRMGSICAWDGCLNTCRGDLPPDWVNALVYWAPTPQSHTTLAQIAFSPFCTRDMTLCAEHAQALEALLKPLGRAMDTPAGEA
jgi:hypothetical protein